MSPTAARAALEQVGSRLDASPARLIPPNDESRRAAVGILLRPSVPCSDTNNKSSDCSELEALFMLRSTNPLDRWSGHVSFPGGRQEPGETDLQTAKREVCEEVGIDVDSAGFELLGRVNDRMIRHSDGSSMVVCAFVFGSCDASARVGKLDPGEVCAAGKQASQLCHSI
jgi:8-oxo-dGTP pyrophosphatase MutT (NUDIX family)